MALVLNDRVKETTTTTGTSSFALGGAVTGFQTFSAGVGANNTTYYAIASGSDWEVGLGTLSSDGLTLARTTILQSSNSDSIVTFGSGSKDIFCTYPASKAVTTDTAVVAPASSTDNAIARYDGTTGKVIQNSTVTLDDNGNLASVNSVGFDTTPSTLPTAEGSLYWNTSEGTLDLVMKGGNVVQQIGEEQYYTVRNETGSTIANGTPVMANGVTAGSGRITVTPAIANGSIDELRFIGLTTESITNGINGYVTSFGYVRGLDTRGTPYGETWAEGDIIYVSPTTAGYLTNVEPTAPNLKIIVAIVITRNQTSGVLLVRPTAYPHITHLSDVNISSPTSGNTLIYDAVQSRWENASITGGTGLSVTNGAGTIALANTGVTSITGTSNEIDVSSSTGAVTLSLPATITADLNGTATNSTNARVTSSTSSSNLNVVFANNTSSSSGNYGLLQDATLDFTFTPSTNTLRVANIVGSLSGNATNVTGTVAIANGGTGATNASTALSNLGAYPASNPNGYTSNTGTVTSITAGTGLTGGTITTSGTIAIDSTVATLTGTQTLTNKTLTSPVLTTASTSGAFTFGGAIDETVFAVTGTTPALSPSNGTIQTWTLSGNSTPTAGTWNDCESLTLMVLDGTAYTITWTSVSVTWVGGTAPILDTAKQNVIELWKVGGVVYGAIVGAA